MPAHGSVRLVGGESVRVARLPFPLGKLIALATLLSPVSTIAVRVALISALSSSVRLPFSMTMIVSLPGLGPVSEPLPVKVRLPQTWYSVRSASRTVTILAEDGAFPGDQVAPGVEVHFRVILLASGR